MLSIKKLAGPKIIERLKSAILSVNGNELFFRGVLDQEGRLSKVEPLKTLRPTRELIAPPWNLILSNRANPGESSKKDLDLAGWLAESNFSFLIIDNQVSCYRPVIEPKDQLIQLQTDETQNIFSQNGSLAKILPGFEPRPSQNKMVDLVAKVCNHGSFEVVEAPTGTGKSIAYLIPCVKWAILNDQRILVSTHTINLQHQLFDKDIPLVRKVLNEDFEAVLVKGRANYLCRRRLSIGLEGSEQELFPQENSEFLESLASWMKKTQTGDRAELSGIPEDVWDEIASDGDYCLGQKCRFAGECFFRLARRKAIDARIMVANHALLCADLITKYETGPGGGLLPGYDRIVIDEAHNFEDVATDSFSVTLSLGAIMRQATKLSKRGARPSGLLHFLKNQSGLSLIELTLLLLDDLIQIVVELQQESEKRFSDLTKILLDHNENLSRRVKRTDHRLLELLNTHLMPLSPKIRALVDSLKKLLAIVSNFLAKEADQGNESESTQFAAQQIEVAIKKFEAFGELIVDFTLLAQESMVYWIEIRQFRGRARLFLNRSPLSVREILDAYLLKPAEGLVFTSATLADTKGNFSFFTRRIGLDLMPPERWACLQLETEFDYANRVLLAVNTSFPERPTDDFASKFAVFARDFIRASQGRVFFLFTSWKMLESCWDACQNLFELEMASSCLKQGKLDRVRLLETFKTLPQAVLFGTSSFWEGVDVKGELLIAIVIVRLPFMVPDDPLVSARMELIEQEGRSSFSEYSLPHAIIRFRQGFGRLLRSRSDYGVVVVLDPRLLTKNYGRSFLRALPETQTFSGNDQEIARAVRTHLARFE